MDIKNLINDDDNICKTPFTCSSSSSLMSSPMDSSGQASSSSPRSSPTILAKLNESPKVLNTIMKTKKKGIYKCSHCSTHFSNFIELAKHYDEYDIKREFHCPMEDCPWHVLGLPNKNELNRHIKSQHQPRQFACRLGCDYKFHRADTRNRHEKQVHLNENSRLNKSQRNKKLKLQNAAAVAAENRTTPKSTRSLSSEPVIRYSDFYNYEGSQFLQYLQQQQQQQHNSELRRTTSLPLIPILQPPFGYPPPPPMSIPQPQLQPPVHFPPTTIPLQQQSPSSNQQQRSPGHFYYGTHYRVI